MVELLLIRHGQVRKATKDDVIGTLEDFRLTSVGIDEAQRLGRYFSQNGNQLSTIYSSPAVHAQQTATIMAPQRESFGSILINPELRKNDHGDWKDRKLGEAYTPEVEAEMNANKLDWRGHNGESRRQMGMRLGRFLESISQFSTGRVGLVTHNLPIREFLREFGLIDLGASPELPNTSITRLNYDRKFELLGVGETPHLVY